QDMGLSSAAIQKDDLTHHQSSNLFWINTGAGATLMLLVAALGPAIAWFFGQEEVKWVTIATSSTFLLGGLGAQHSALLRRAMRFTSLAWVRVASAGIGVVVSIVSA